MISAFYLMMIVFVALMVETIWGKNHKLNKWYILILFIIFMVLLFDVVVLDIPLQNQSIHGFYGSNFTDNMTKEALCNLDATGQHGVYWCS